MNLGSDDLCALIGRVMGEVLLTAPLARDADFFESGGDSLRAVEMLQRLGAVDGAADWLGSLDVQARMLEGVFEDATPAGLASVALAAVG